MSDVSTLILYLVIGGIIIFLFRELPFLLFRDKAIPSFVLYLGKVLPMAVMCILVIYGIKNTNFSSVNAFLPQLLSIAVVAALHIWKRNTTLSIFAGTICYMVLIRIL